MSKVALRVYNREIEALIDQGHVDEAVAHCQHILKTFPKHLETYKLLGKAYLEGQRYPDAADIFQRILLAIPDDFISHLGMSIIRDEQKDMDAAIWHMERAYEANPSNGGVQGELRRLYGRRDGLEPPKIRLTRGALAQMYTKGEQIQQAIAEIKAVLAEDPTRNDMKVLIARAYFRGGYKVEATEACTDLLKQYPYSLDGNRILVELLPGTSMAQNLDTYRKRVHALDPYAAFVTGSIFETGSVPDNAVTIDRYEWDTESAPQTSYPALSQPQTTTEESIPDFLRTSGWGPSTGAFQDGPLNLDEPEPAAPTAGGDLAAADIPEWLKAMAPPQSSASQPGGNAPADDDLGAADLDWLAGLGGPLSGGQPAAAPAAPASNDQPDWLKGMSATPSIEPIAPAENEDLDWLSGLGNQPPAQPTAPAASSEPEWMKSLGAESTPAAPASDGNEELDWLAQLGGPVAAAEPPVIPIAETQVPPENQPATPASDQPDWLKDFGAESPATPIADEDMDWLAGLGAPLSPQEPPVETPSTPVAAQEPSDWLQDLGTVAAAGVAGAAAEESLDWLGSLDAPREEKAAPSAPDAFPTAASQPAAESDADEMPDWLRGMGAEQAEPPAPAAAEVSFDLPSFDTTPTEPEPVAPAESEPLPDWLSNMGAPQKAEPPAPAAKPRPMGQDDPNFVPPPLSGLVAGPGTSESEQDDAMKWLEMLAAKQGAKSEELLTNPEERIEHAPGWVAQVGAEPEEIPAAPPVIETPAPVAAQPVVETPAPAAKPRPMGQDDPNFVPPPLSGLVAGPGTSETEQDDAMKWLEMLAAKQGAKSEELLTNPEERIEHAPGWVAQVGAEPEEIPAAPPVIETPAPAAAKPVVETPAPAAKPRPMAQDDPNFVPPPLSDLVAGPGTSESEQDDAMKWLEMLAAKQGAKSEELLTNPEERIEHAPGWVAQVGAEPEEIPAAPPVIETPAPVAAKPVIEPPAPAAKPRPMGQDDPNFVPPPLSELVAGPGTSESEQDDAMKWLEMLAAKQGAKSEELLTNPEERIEHAPGWVAQVGAEPEEIPAAPPVIETPVPAAAKPVVEPPAPAAKPRPMAQDDPNFVPPPLSELVSGPGTSETEQDDAMKWLEMLAAKQGAKSEELLTNPEERIEHAPGWVAQVGTEGEPEAAPAVEEPQAVEPAAAEPVAAQDLSWLQELAAEAPQDNQPVELPETEVSPTEQPEWLTDFSVTAAASAASAATPAEEAPEWLGNLSQPEIEEPAAALPEAEPVEDASKVMPWETQPIDGLWGEEPTPAEPAQPEETLPWAEAETPAQPVEPTPWEPEVAPAETEPETQTGGDISEWLKTLDEPDQPVQAAPEVEIPSTVAAESVAAPVDEFPTWLKDMDSPVEQGTQEDLPDWLKDQSADEQPPAQVTAPEWVTAETPPPPAKTEPPVSQAPVIETAKPAPVESRPAPERIPAPVQASTVTPPPAIRPALRQTGMLGGSKEAVAINRSRDLLAHGGLDAAMKEYSGLIKKGKLLEEIIYDLKEATYAHPVDVVVWQTLGDAYMRANQLQEALDAYTKAEELLR